MSFTNPSLHRTTSVFASSGTLHVEFQDSESARYVTLHFTQATPGGFTSPAELTLFVPDHSSWPRFAQWAEETNRIFGVEEKVEEPPR